MTDRTPPAPATPARRGRAAGWVLAVAAIYLAALWYLDRDRNILSRLLDLAAPLAACSLLVLASYIARYQRWRQVLGTLGHPLHGWAPGLLAYLAGFAFTASPGKAGELLRIRYFNWQGIPPATTLTAFIFERALDLLVITAMAVGAAALVPVFGMLAAIILGILLALAAMGCLPVLARGTHRAIEHLPGLPVRRLAHFLVGGASALGPLLRPRVLAPGTLLGLLAWLLTALAFTLLCHAQGITLAWPLALGIYPLAMLVGALSFVPGGVGTTEAAIVLMLAASGVPTDTALAVAIGIRLASLWLAVLVGMFSAALLELRFRPRHAP
ncbi:lysylphosphatidylglycerol synthase transmembrane domain-containing protein [Stenotrophomonas sp. 24(2023)]|uniref:lysylphosphatidylglycerol synthase transmembrane domain-containing protein n=1 Tax=Stenotrophomonas sp. 24(2023) TaxID=3068324 RepID=UPI0027DF5347|nr:lysylphosphatidylglycerol synthase transmembrane domain-containing protein [Stenotrophomonas sp. 24(2023)]WMJ67741.1 lysylphosphatidylglycerol synthase transmembrane domain-containing protein [Stenotrophomonas sp. 24(2023)]